MLEVEGAGGVPEVLAVCLNPRAIVQVFVGMSYDKFLVQCSVGGFLDSVVTLTHLVGEIHDRGIVHNDVQPRNITFTGSVSQPVFHIIDLGLACRPGHIAGNCLFKCDISHDSANRSGDADIHNNAAGNQKFRLCGVWMAPEVLKGRPVFFSGDVYSFGFLIANVASECIEFLKRHLREVEKLCIRRDPERRCSLTNVAQAIKGIRDQLGPEHLKVALDCRKHN